MKYNFRIILLNNEFDRLGKKSVQIYFEILSHFSGGTMKNQENHASISDVQAKLPNAIPTNTVQKCHFWNQFVRGSIIQSFPRY
jgi:hypothetical protein